MNVFEKFRLNKVLKLSPNEIYKKYESYPDYIKNNDEVIKKIIDIKYAIKKIDKDTLKEFFKKNPEYLNTSFEYLYIHDNDILNEILNKEPSYINKIFYNVKESGYKLVWFKNIIINNPEIIKYFDIDVIKKFWIFAGIKYLEEIFQNKNIKEYFEELYDWEKIDLINKNKKYYYLGDNKHLIEQLDLKMQLQLFLEDNNLFKFLSFKARENIVKNNPTLLTNMSLEDKMDYIKFNGLYLQYCDNLEVVSNYLKFIENKNEYKMFEFLYNRGYVSIINDSYLKEGLKRRLNNFPKLYNVIFKKNNIFVNRNDNGVERDLALNIKQLLLFLNDDILLKNSEDALVEYFNNLNNECFRKIIINTYGQEMEKLFEERPRLNLDTIDDIRIFDKRILENLGENFIKQVINYKFDKLPYVIHSILDSEKMMNDFKVLYKYIQKNVGNGFESIDLAIEKFAHFKQILKDIDMSTLLTNKKQMMDFIIFDELYSFEFERIDQIDKYLQIRESKSKMPKISCYIGFNEKKLEEMLSILNGNVDIEGILNNEDLEILQILKYTVEPGINKELLIEIMEQNKEKFNPARIHEISIKIKTIYNHDYNQTVDSRSLNECETCIIDGIEVVELKGTDFCFLASGVNGYTQSKLFEGKKNNLKPEEVVQNWLKMENGVSTISTSLFSETNCFSNYLGYTDFFGFEKFNNNQIIGMYDNDAGASHWSRQIEQGNGNNLSLTTKQMIYYIYENRNRKTIGSKNETILKRYDDNGNKILPDFILVYSDDEAQLQCAIMMVKEFRKIGHEMKIYRIYKEFYKNKSCSPDERYNEPPRVINTPLLDEINNVLNKGVII